jgi:DNA-binding transcriptional LysR family regulator
MDTEWARTFLTVVATGNFIRAADRLHVTQSTVSARIRALEQQLGCTLFVRNKAGATLTPAGRQFQKHAATLTRTFEQARQDAGIAHGYRAVLTVGGRFALWVELLLKWLPLMRQLAPDVSLRGEIDVDDGLMNRLVDGTLDVGVMYTPQSRPSLTVEYLFDEHLVLATSDPTATGHPGEDYVFVDWGPEFSAKHSMNFPDFGTPTLVVGIAWLGLQHILQHGGSGYFPMRLVRRYIESGRLHEVSDAPSFTQPVYMVYPAERDSGLFAPALSSLRDIAAAAQRQEKG